MIQVSMRNYRRVDARGVEVKRLLVLILAAVAALANTAFEQDAILLRFYQVTRAGALLCRTVECD